MDYFRSYEIVQNYDGAGTEAFSTFFPFAPTLTALLAGLGLQIIVDVASGKLELKAGWRRYFWISTTLGLVMFLLALAIDAWSASIFYAKIYLTVDANPILVNRSFLLPLRRVIG